MKTKLLPLLFILFLAMFLVPVARADGIIVPEPPICNGEPCFDPIVPIPMDQLVIRYHNVTVTIVDQVAITHVDQVFYNPNDWTIEGTYIFPLPKGAAVSGFTLWIDGQPVEGQVLDAEEARRTYEEIVRQLIDPALLEYADRGAVRARVFPIPSGGERRIELEYTQALAADNGLVRYQYPLNTEKFSVLPLENVSVSVDVRSSTPLRAVYSPSHKVDIQWDGKNNVRAGYEASDVLPDTDFALFYSLGEEEAFHLLSYRNPSDPNDPDGFFLLMLAPRPDAASTTVPKDVLIVLDRSGSMDGEKFIQAQDALRFILNNLNRGDRFNIITFSTGIDQYASDLRPANEGGKALGWVDRLSAAGSTDINRALLEAAGLVDRERPTYLIFLTDGLPTEGVTDSQAILDNFGASAPKNLRLFVFGVGYDVDTFLLDSLAQEHHGTSTYVLPGERLDENLSAFYEKISTPVLTDLDLNFGDINVYDLYPSPLPDLFVGSQIVLVGRYREGGTTDVTLTGVVNGEKETFRYSDLLFITKSLSDQGPLAAIPRLWATRKIGYLLNQIRLQGPEQETIDQIVRLSIRYGIVTPYTSYLVTEPMPLGADAQSRIAGEEFRELEMAAPAPISGQQAVEKAAEQGDLADADAPALSTYEDQSTIRIVGSRTFVNAEGVWIDTAFDPVQMETVKVAFLSADYFALTEIDPDLAAAFALGQHVITFSNGTVYEVVPADSVVDPIELPQSATEVNPDGSPTDEPVNVTPAPTGEAEVEPTATSEFTPTPVPGTVPCLGGLLPLAIIPLGLVIFLPRPKK